MRAETPRSPSIDPTQRVSPPRTPDCQFAFTPSRDSRRAAGHLHQGSGSITHASGIVLTNDHAVQWSTRGEVELSDGRPLPFEVPARHPPKDLALLRLSAGAPFPTLALGRSHDLLPAEPVLITGTPNGLGEQIGVLALEPDSPAHRAGSSVRHRVTGVDRQAVREGVELDFASLEPVRTETLGSAQLPASTSSANRFAVRLRGYLEAQADGIYSFWLGSDDGSRLRLGSRRLVDNDGLRAHREAANLIRLRAGLRGIEIQRIEAGGDASLALAWLGPGFGKQAVPASAFFRPKREAPRDR